MLCRRLFMKIYFGNPDWNMEWSGTVGRRNPAYHSDLRTPLFCGNPHPGHGRVCTEMVMIRVREYIFKSECKVLGKTDRSVTSQNSY